MKLWIDNTGLDSVRRCLAGHARGEFDVRGLLQLATLLVFGDKLSVNGFEMDRVAKRAKWTKTQLEKIGLDPQTLEITHPDPKKYRTACDVAARHCAMDLKLSAFDPSELVDHGQQELIALNTEELAPFGDNELIFASKNMLLRAIVRPLIGLNTQDQYVLKGVDLEPRAAANSAFNSLIVSKEEELTKDRLQGMREHALEMKATGAIAYMFAASRKLRDAVRNLKDFDPQSAAHVYRLNGFLRYYLNVALAGTYRQYTPAVLRAQLVKQQEYRLVDRLSNQIDVITSIRRGSRFRSPSLTTVLVSRSKGDPEALIREALELRTETNELRSWLSHRMKAKWFGWPSSEDPDYSDKEVQKKGEELVRKLSDLVKQDLGLGPKEAPKLVDCIIPTIVGGILPVPLGKPEVTLGIGVIAFGKWAKYRWDRRKIVILTEISREAALPTKHPHYELLVKTCCRHVNGEE